MPQPSADASEHPLMPVLRWAYEGLPTVESLKDYSAIMVKRERVGRTVEGPQYLLLKLGNKPFSVYARFLSPVALKGQEVIYVEGENHGNMLAHRPGGVTSMPEAIFVKVQRNRQLG